MVIAPLPTRRTITKRRKALGWSLRTLAARAGKDHTYVVRIFTGQYWPAPHVYPKLIAAIEKGESRQRAGKQP